MGRLTVTQASWQSLVVQDVILSLWVEIIIAYSLSIFAPLVFWGELHPVQL